MEATGLPDYWSTWPGREVVWAMAMSTAMDGHGHGHMAMAMAMTMSMSTAMAMATGMAVGRVWMGAR